MKRAIVVIGILLIVAGFAFARSAKSDYQWTGTVLEVDSDHIVIQKGNEKWEFAQDKDTQVTGTLKAGSKATVYYVMKAVKVEVK